MRKNTILARASSATFLFLCVPKLIVGLEITALSPTSGPTTPGLKVLIHGKAFPKDAKVFFSGLEARQIKRIDGSTIEVTTPYLRPGNHSVALKSGKKIVISRLTFSSLASWIDTEINQALAFADQGQSRDALGLLTRISETHDDQQVRSFAYHQKSLINYFTGDWSAWRADAAGIYLNADNPEMCSIQTYWPYGLAYARSYYLVARQDPSDKNQLAPFNRIIELDVTGSKEPRLYRALVSARMSHFLLAKLDVADCLRSSPNDSRYLALAAYVAAASGETSQAVALGERALSRVAASEVAAADTFCLLGEAAYMSGRKKEAESHWAMAGASYPRGAIIAFLAAKKHLWRGDQDAAAMLFAECIAMNPAAPETSEALELLSGLRGRTQFFPFSTASYREGKQRGGRIPRQPTSVTPDLTN